MASWVDYLSLALVLALLGGFVFTAVALNKKYNKFVQDAEGSLQKHGLYITSNGVKIRLDMTYEHEQYIDDTRKILINIVKASSFGTVENKKSLADLVTFAELPRRKKPTLLPAQ